VVVAVVLVRAVQAPVDEIVDVLTVRDRFVAAARSMPMAGVVPRVPVVPGTAVGVPLVDRDHVVVDVVAVRMMQMTVVQEVQVRLVDDRGMPAARPVDVLVPTLVDVMVGCAHVPNGTRDAGAAPEGTLRPKGRRDGAP
jgi:hypothetical protein